MTTTTAPPSDTVSLTINGTKVTAKKGTLLVEAAKQAGIDIPVFCYHEKLKPVGACRMCLVEIEKMPRLQTACTSPVAEGMVVRTQSQMAKEGQQSVLALLLANHPLDCPVCDKGGECPLQDNTFNYGPGVSQFQEEKRHKDKAFELSDRIVLDRERCILCYRCVRFHEEIPGDRALAVIDRGGYGEIGVLPGETYDSPFQGNTIDICPVGALTSRQYRFRSRPWDLRTAESIACDDATGANIEIDVRDGRVLRVRPRENLDVNDAWIADHTRFNTIPIERGLRLGTPLVRVNGTLKPASWTDAIAKAGALIKKSKTGYVASPSVSNEAMAVLDKIGGDDAWAAPGPSPWPCKGSIASIAKSKTVVVIGLDLWSEMPMLSLWTHRAALAGASIVVVNEKNGPANGGMARDTRRFIRADKGDLKQRLADLVTDVEKGTGAAIDLKQRPTTLLFSEQIARDPEAKPLLEKLATLLEATGEGGLVGAPSKHVNGRGAGELMHGKPVDGADTLVVVGDADLDTGKARVVWLHAGFTAEKPDVPDFVDVVLPLAHPYEQAGSFTNLEGRVQHFDAAGSPPGSARADWQACVALASELGVPVPSDLRSLREQFSTYFAKLPKRKASLPVMR
jgi:NADH-quinone oxidoreductase subunit G